MPGKNRFYLIGCSVALFVLLAIAISTRLPAQTRRLGDGSLLSIAAVSYGRNHSYDLPNLKPRQNFIVEHVPQYWTDRLGWFSGGGRISVNAEGDEPPLLVVFTLCKMATPNSFSSAPRVDLCDESGHIYESTSNAPTVSSADLRLRGWAFFKPLPGSKQLILRFSDIAADAQGRIPMAEFDVPNPVPKIGEVLN